MSLPAVMVTGATGAQGGAVARQLRALGHPVHATARDPTSPAAQALASLGVDLTQASWDEEAALRSATSGCTKLFLNLMPSMANFIGGELAWAKRIIALAREAGVDHLVYTSSAYTTRLADMPSVEVGSIVWHTTSAKLAVEAEVKAAGFEHYTLLRPGFFMQNFVSPGAGFMYASLVGEGVWVTGIPADTPVPLIDTEDIGRFAVAAFRDPGRFVEVDLASEYRTPVEIVRALSDAVGRGIELKVLTSKELAEAEDKDIFIKAQKVVGDLGRFLDLERVRAYRVPLGTFPKFLEREGEKVEATYGHLKGTK